MLSVYFQFVVLWLQDPLAYKPGILQDAYRKFVAHGKVLGLAHQEKLCLLARFSNLRMQFHMHFVHVLSARFVPGDRQALEGVQGQGVSVPATRSNRCLRQRYMSFFETCKISSEVHWMRSFQGH